MRKIRGFFRGLLLKDKKKSLYFAGGHPHPLVACHTGGAVRRGTRWWCNYCCEHDALPSRGVGSPWAERCDAALNQASLRGAPGQGRVSGGKPYTSGPAYQVAPRPGTAPCQAGRAVPSRMAWAPGAHWARARPVWKPAVGRRTGPAGGGRTPTTRRRAREGTGWIRGPRAGARWEARRSQRRVYLPPGGNGNQFRPRCGRTSRSFQKRGQPTTQRRCSAGGRQGPGARRLGAWYSCLSLPRRPPPTSSPPLLFFSSFFP